MEKNKLTEAVRDLRSALGETQQTFASRMKTAIRTVARWETTRPPSGASLAQLERLAATKGLEDLTAVFRAALADELGNWETSSYTSVYSEPRTESEKLWVAALLATLRNPQYADRRARLIPLLREPAEGCIKILERHKLANSIAREVDRLTDMGVEPSAIAKDLKVPEQDVRSRTAIRELVRTVQQANVWADERSRKKPE
jgi:transcriptional regulator with XRE-family HTH domain